MALLYQNNANFRARNYSNKAITLNYLRVSYHDTMFSNKNVTLGKNIQHTPSLFMADWLMLNLHLDYWHKTEA